MCIISAPKERVDMNRKVKQEISYQTSIQPDMVSNAEYRVKRQIFFCYGHRLRDYTGPCKNVHGHNGKIEIELSSKHLDRRGMVVDFIDVGFWPVFNIADAAISVSVIGLVLYYWKKK